MRTKSVTQVVAPSLLVAMLWFAVSGYPSLKAARDADTRYEAAKTETAALLDSLVRIQTLPTELAETERRASLVVAAIPEQMELGSLIQSVDRAGQENNVLVESFSPIQILDNTSSTIETRVPDGISSVSFGLAAMGTYEDIIGFALALENLDRLLVLDSIEIFADAEDSLVLVTEIQLRVFTSGALTDAAAGDLAEELAYEQEAGSADSSASPLPLENLPVSGEFPGSSTELEIAEFLESAGETG